ncbi:hypothetical protein H10PHJ05_32 [Aeromonas phage HJ05]|nr:hypothetical protein H10PHJ05_32 [Aeromonas phage HJ05]
MGETSEATTLGRKRRRVVKAVQVMTDPNPQFVSLVKHGANQTPVTVFRSVEPTASDDQAKQEDNEMGSTTKQPEARLSVSRSNGGLHKLGFPSEVFATEQAVRSYLDAQGYEGGTITAADDGFEVVARSTESFKEGSIKAIPGEDGVVRHVGVEAEGAAGTGDTPAVDPAQGGDAPEGQEEAAKGAADGAGGEPEGEGKAVVVRSILTGDNPLLPSTAAEVVKRYDSWEARWSEGLTIQSVMAEGVDGLPVGIWEVHEAFYTALRNVILTGNKEGIATLCAEFGGIITRLVDVLPFASMPQEMVTKMLDKPAASTAEVAVRSAEAVQMAPNMSDDQLKEVAAKVAGLLSSDKSPLLQLVAKSVGDASGQSESIQKDLGNLREQVAQSLEQLGKLSDAQTQMAQKVDHIYQAPPQSRSASDDWIGQIDGQQSVPVRKDSGAAPVDPLFRNSLGMG